MCAKTSCIARGLRLAVLVFCVRQVVYIAAVVRHAGDPAVHPLKVYTNRLHQPQSSDEDVKL